LAVLGKFGAAGTDHHELLQPATSMRGMGMDGGMHAIGAPERFQTYSLRSRNERKHFEIQAFIPLSRPIRRVITRHHSTIEQEEFKNAAQMRAPSGCPFLRAWERAG
jgi:hypothetical protein